MLATRETLVFLQETGFLLPRSSNADNRYSVRLAAPVVERVGGSGHWQATTLSNRTN